MKKVNYSELETVVHEVFHESRSLGLNVLQAAEKTFVELWMTTESSELEHLIVNLVLGKILLEEQVPSAHVRQELLKHYENQTLLRNKNDLDTEDYNRLVSDLESVTSSWR